jgi:hypothetical protein
MAPALVNEGVPGSSPGVGFAQALNKSLLKGLFLASVDDGCGHRRTHMDATAGSARVH